MSIIQINFLKLQGLISIKHSMLPVLVLFFTASFFAAFLILISHWAAPKDKATPAKKEAYECGIVSDRPSSSRVPVKFYLTGLLFIIFDIEIIFLYPFAVAYRDFLEKGLGVQVLLAVGFFLALFVFGLWWEIRTKALEWK